MTDLSGGKQDEQRDKRPYCFAPDGKHEQPNADQINQRRADNQQRIGGGFVFVKVFIPAGSQDKRLIDDGISRNLDPGEPEERNIYEAMEAGKAVKKLPMTLGDALDRLEADEVVLSALPDEMAKVFFHYKRDEWEKFNATVTNWDLESYWDCLP